MMIEHDYNLRLSHARKGYRLVFNFQACSSRIFLPWSDNTSFSLIEGLLFGLSGTSDLRVPSARSADMLAEPQSSTSLSEPPQPTSNRERLEHSREAT
jgi:hypothetical protein